MTAAPETDASEYGRQADLCDALVRLLHNEGDGGIWEEFDKDNAILVANVIVDSAPVCALLADLDAARVREVECERDARIRVLETALYAQKQRARAESAEAAHEALRAGVEALAEKWDRGGISHDLRALLDGTR